MRILIVEDENHLRKIIKLNLEMEQYEVVAAENGKKALQAIKEQHFDAIILDIMLPDISGIKICEIIRLENYQTPILILSAKDTSSDRILGLKTGADDYLTKPFDFQELLLRIQKLIQRSASDVKSEVVSYEFGPNSVNLASFEAKNKNGKFRISQREAKLLKLLIEHKNEAISRHQILKAVWGYDVYPTTRTIDNFILAFRKYFESDPKKPEYFRSVRGVGYKFTDSKI